MTTNADQFDFTAAPMRIGQVRLKVRDLAQVSDFYERVLGVRRIAESDDQVTLGSGTTPLLQLSGDPSLAPRDPRAAGLFHSAFLLPDRSDLARWFAFAMEARTPLQGASDHIVSEAIYLADPEGNGIEVYADRPPSRWRGRAGETSLATNPLDTEDLLSAAADTKWAGFPEGGLIGHVHLQVGDTEAADRFYRDVLGFDIAARYPGASFYGSGGYHHQLAGNVWNSLHARRRPEDMAGLEAFKIVLRDAAERDAILARAESAGIAVTHSGDGTTLHDPWGTAITLRT